MKRIGIIGAGPSGLTAARFLAEADHAVDIIEKRSHLGGNCYDEYDENSILIHRYGPHYFRTNSHKLLSWLSQFTEWIPGQYYVRAQVGESLLPLPIGLSTLTQLRGELFEKEKFEHYLKEQTVHYEVPKNCEEQCLATVGKELYNLIFKGYTQKQWGVSPKELDPSITARIPVRFDWDERYPSEKIQVMPKDGYTKMFSRMADHPNIKIFYNQAIQAKDIPLLRREYDLLLYTGPIDAFYNFKFGKLEYRSLSFEWQYFKDLFVQPCVQINYPNEHAYTRTIEYKHITGQKVPGTVLCYEYPQVKGEPFYPLLTHRNKEIFQKYLELSKKETLASCPVHFIGRLAEFKYYNMDHAILNAMKIVERIIREWTNHSPYLQTSSN